MSFFASCVLVVIVSSSVLAQTDREVIRVEGEPVRIAFADGRLGQIEAAFTDWNAVPFEMRWSHSNGCTSVTLGKQCVLYNWASVDSARMRWLKHSDSTKIGQIAKLRDQDADFQSKENILNFSTPDRSVPPGLHLECVDGNWPSTSILIDMWSSEINTFNSQTELEENQIFNGRYNMELRQNGGHWLISNPGLEFGQPDTLNFLGGYYGDVLTLSVRGGGEDCAMVFKGNLAAAIEKFVNMESSSQFSTYIYKIGGFVDRDAFNFSFTYADFE